MGTYVATPLAAIGTRLQIGDGAETEVFTTVALVSSISGPSKSRATIDTTNHNSPDKYAEFIGGLKESGEVSFTLFFDPGEPTHVAGTNSLDAFYEDGLRHNFRMLVWGQDPDQYSWTFAGVVTKLDFKYEVAGAQTCDCSIKVSGKATLAKMTTPVP